jgi:hypothetical protein
MVAGTRGAAHAASAPIEMAMSSGCGENKIRRLGMGMAVGVVGKCVFTYSYSYQGDSRRFAVAPARNA